MAAVGDVSPQSYYIQHHLVHNNNVGGKQSFIADFGVINYDSMFWSLLMGLIAVFSCGEALGTPQPAYPEKCKLLSSCWLTWLNNRHAASCQMK
jgi:hypothetical protein